MREYLLCLFAAAAVTYLLTPLVRASAIRFGAMAEVRDRDVHLLPTARWGGLAMAGGFLVAVLLASNLPLMGTIFQDRKQITALLLSAGIIVILGILDDRFGLDAPTKLVGQVLAAAVLSLKGVTLVWLPIGGIFILDPSTSVLATVLVVLVSINAVNMTDGLDGLAASFGAIGAAAFFAYSYFLSVQNGYQRATLATLISAAVVGMCIGFLPHNWFRARIFMGDTGSMLIGLCFAASSIMLTGQVDPGGLTGGVLLPAFLPVVLPLIILSVPLVDLFLAIVRRTRKGRSPFAPDKEHLHHRLLDLGHGQERAVLIMSTFTAVVAFGAVSLAFVPVWLTAVGVAFGIFALIVWVLNPPENSVVN
ncbi:MAG: undecaprenyl/decaprenyl-phosphate alpha-N-acetylglucosaminyl 1-phosphate transferase [Actinobacteria bacterium]|nr:undecaprenyl/decaprenyl-phosphate alpha-N-acetylglucosaminyl 1-phosphate transferase [Actinomycetota bacterium]NBY15678.1 undecaprenyl/decaprenyl-phosphate alpha-N-acetylglucosaminyl 1-phosphate transferase [Actinomycetota bacterium]